MSKQTVDQLRSATLGQAFTKRSVTVEHNGVELEVRQPSVKQILGIQDKYRKIDGEGNIKIDTCMLGIALIIELTYLPGTNEKVYTPEDFNAFAEMPENELLANLGKAVREVQGKDKEEAKKSTSDAEKSD